MGALSLMITFQRDGPSSLRKTFLGFKIAKRWQEGLHLKGAEKEITTAIF